MTLDAETSAFVSSALASRAAPTHELTPQQARERSAALVDILGPGPHLYAVREERIPRDDGTELALRVLLPSPAVRGVIGYLHGGGWVLGSLEEFDCLARNISIRTGCAVVMVDYRLAPENPYPAAVEDAAAALAWLGTHAEDIAGAAAPLLLFGDSAGANLAIGAALGDSQGRGSPLRALVLAYPITDCDFTTASYVDPDNQLLMGVETMRWFFGHYAPESLWPRPDVSVLRARDVSTLPPSLILLAEHDPLRDEGQALADRLRSAGVPVEDHVFQGQMHGFLGLINVLPGADDAVSVIVDYVERLLETPPHPEERPAPVTEPRTDVR